jgi:hypothetical protein
MTPFEALWWTAWKRAMQEGLRYRGYTFVDRGRRFDTDAPLSVANSIANALPTGEAWRAYVESLNLSTEKQ